MRRIFADYEVPIVLISIDVALKKKAGIPSLFKGPFEPLFLLLLQSFQKILSSLSLKVSLYKLCHWVSGLLSARLVIYSDFEV